MFSRLVPSGGAGLDRDLLRVEAAFDVPENVVVDQVDALSRTLDEDRLPLLNAVQEQVSGDAVVDVSAVVPDMVGAERVFENVPPGQAVHTVVQLDSARFPGKFHLLPAGALDQVVLDQHAFGEKSRNAADADVSDRTAADYGITDQLLCVRFMVPAFVADVNANAVRPVDRTVFNDPVMAAVSGDCTPLRNRGTGCRMLHCNALHFNVGKEGDLRCEALFADGDFDFMVFGVVVIFQAEVYFLAVCLDPVGIFFCRQQVI